MNAQKAQRNLVLPWLALLLCQATLMAQPQPGTVFWTFDAGERITTSPALSLDGTIYFGTGSGLFAITNSGSVASNKWAFPVVPASSPVVGPDGTIYFGCGDGKLYAVNPDGSQKWSYQAQGGSGPPAIAQDGTIYFEGYSFLYALTNSGNGIGMKWKALVGDTSHYSGPAIDSNGDVYIGSWDQRLLYAFRPDGSQKWSQMLFSNPGEAPAIGSDGTIYVTGGPLFAFTPDGTNIWMASPPGLNLNGPPVVGKNGTIYVAGSGSHKLYAITPTGEMTWGSLGSGSSFPGLAAAVAGDGMIYYSVSNSVWALTPQGEVRWVVGFPSDPGPGVPLSYRAPIIGNDGTIYAPLGSTLYAIVGTTAAPDSAWPMYQQNARHTGKVEKPALKQPKKRADANFEFQLYAQLGQTNVIETTTNLDTWTSLTSVVVTTVPQPVVDLTASNHPARFYRTISP